MHACSAAPSSALKLSPKRNSAYLKPEASPGTSRRLAVRRMASQEPGKPATAEPQGAASDEAPKRIELKLTGSTPRRFAVASGKLLDISTAAATVLPRLGTGVGVAGYTVSLADDDPSRYSVLRMGGKMVVESGKTETFPRPAKPLELYEFEGCPFCRKVREAINILDLDVIMYPCPRNGPDYRPKVVSMGGKSMFPYLVDPNTGAKMYESDEIIKYLWEKYGDGAGNVPLMLRMGILTTLSVGIGLMARMGKGSMYEPSRMPKEPLVLYGYDASPFTKVVREQLSAMQLPHLWRTSARGSPKRQELFEKQGMFLAPFLEDPNEGVCMFESSEIIEYLKRTYGKA